MKATEITKSIKERIQSSSKTILDTVVDRKVQEEIESRSSILANALKVSQRMEDNIKYFNSPDIITYSETGAENKAFSEKRFTLRKEEEVKLEKLSEFIDLALTENTEEAYLNLQNHVNSL